MAAPRVEMAAIRNAETNLVGAPSGSRLQTMMLLMVVGAIRSKSRILETPHLNCAKGLRATPTPSVDF